MAFSSHVGAFNLTAGAATTTIAVTGVGFVPKVVLFWWGGSTDAVDGASGASINRGFGVATSTTSRWATGTQSNNAATSSDTDRIHREDACIATLTSVGGVDCLMDLQSFDADGFTLVVDDAASALRRIHYQALGGADLTNAATGRFDEPAATGNQDITGVGFQPDFVLFGSIGIATDPPAASTTAIIMQGAATASGQAVLTNTAINNATTMDTSAYSKAGECIATGTSAAGIVRRASLDSFLSDGFRLNWAERFADMVIFWLALKGGSYRVDNFLTSVTPSATIAETGFGFAPTGTMLFSHGRAADTSDVITDSDQWNVGAFTTTSNRGTQGTLDEDNVADSDTEFYVEHDQALAQWTTAPAVVGLVDVQSIDSDGFTLVMDSAANPAAFVWYISFGDTVVAATVTPAVVAATVTIPTPTVQAASVVTPAVVAVTVTIPTPTIIGGVFGQTYLGTSTVGGSNHSMLETESYVKKVSLQAGWIVSHVEAFLRTTDNEFVTVHPVIYLDNAGNPGSLVVAPQFPGSGVEFDGTDRWWPMATGYAVPTTGDYWVGIHAFTAGSLQIVHNSGSDQEVTSGGSWVNEAAGSGGGLAAGGRNYSIRASIIAPTTITKVGRLTTGASNLDLGAEVRLIPVTITAGKVLLSVEADIKVHTASVPSIRGMLYSDNGGVPGIVLHAGPWETDSWLIADTYRRFSFPMGRWVESSGDYWIGVQMGDAGSIHLAFDGTGGSGGNLASDTDGATWTPESDNYSISGTLAA